MRCPLSAGVPSNADELRPPPGKRPTGPTAQEIDAVRAHIVVRCRGAEVDELMGMLGLSGEPD